MDQKPTTVVAAEQAVVEAAAAAMAQAKAPTRVRENDVSTRIIRRHYKPMGLWLRSPGVAHPFVTMMWALEDLAAERKVDVGSASLVTKVRLAMIEQDPGAKVESDHRIFL